MNIRHKKNRWLSYYLPLLFWMGVIFSFSAMEGGVSHRNPDLWFYAERKGAHVFEYFVLSILFFRVLSLQNIASSKKRNSVVIFSLAYAIYDEIHQLFVPGRDGKLLDVGVDLIGIALAVIAWNVWAKRNKGR